MKKFLVVLLMFVSALAQAQSDYYWYKGKKISITPSKNLVYISAPDSTQLTASKLGTNLSFAREKFKGAPQKYNDNAWKIVEIKSGSLPVDATSLQKASPAAQIHIAPVFGNDTMPIATTEFFYVQLKSENDLPVLKAQAEKLGTEILTQVPYMPTWYKLKAPLGSNGLTMANTFYETNLFAEIDPGFMFHFKNNACPTDPSFVNQWGLRNTSFAGIDVNACNAWDLTLGAGVTVAILDQGVDAAHPEFAANYSPLSWNAMTGSSPSVVYGNHGTHVGGIVGANQNNYMGSGVAPAATILSVSHSLGLGVNTSQQLASGINYAWQNGAAVINNSWGDQGGAYYFQLQSAMLDNAIASAIANGRGGLGTVVIFAAGNFNGPMDYPANSNANILTVGSIANNGTRSSFSSFGTGLDVVAPGSNIWSTLPSNGEGSMSGTSMAAPMVAGVAALVIAVSPNLTGLQVRNAIESTAKKVGGYTYTPGSPNGSWNNQMGYGLVDAVAAIGVGAGCGVNPVTTYNSVTVTSNTTITGCFIHSSNVTVAAGKLHLNASRMVTITPTFTVNAGQELQLGN
ncbi:S8 family peptidase [Chitinophaga skermanii]|nr:S8 family serine peptidase [Chitinophaga skermanii]